MFNDLDYSDLVKTLNHSTRMMKIQRNNEKLQREHQWMLKLKQGTEFCLRIYYRDSVKYDGRPVYECIYLEGIENAERIFSTYRTIGFGLKIQKMELSLKKEVVKKLQFNYKIDK